MGIVLEVCNCVDVKEPVRLMTEVLEVAAVVDSTLDVAVLVRLEKRGFVDSVGVDNSGVVAVAECPDPSIAENGDDSSEVVAVVGCPDLSIAENGYGWSEVVRLVSQQFAPPRRCPAAPAQHQLLPLGSQRLTSSKPSN